jgi:hypothetical protein
LYSGNAFRLPEPSTYAIFHAAEKLRHLGSIGRAFAMPMPKKPRPPCLHCGSTVKSPEAKYCSNRCQSAHQHRNYIQAWKRGTETGLKADESVSDHIRKYLTEKYGEQCSVCGWHKRNPITGEVPIMIDHIDGDWRNNREENLRLVCPNCHSLTPTYMNLNRGKGRRYRRKYEVRENGSD